MTLLIAMLFMQAQVPEPASILLLVAGVGALALFGRKKK
jgi:hypothetical protein